MTLTDLNRVRARRTCLVIFLLRLQSILAESRTFGAELGGVAWLLPAVPKNPRMSFMPVGLAAAFVDFGGIVCKYTLYF